MEWKNIYNSAHFYWDLKKKHYCSVISILGSSIQVVKHEVWSTGLDCKINSRIKKCWAVFRCRVPAWGQHSGSSHRHRLTSMCIYQTRILTFSLGISWDLIRFFPSILSNSLWDVCACVCVRVYMSACIYMCLGITGVLSAVNSSNLPTAGS